MCVSIHCLMEFSHFSIFESVYKLAMLLMGEGTSASYRWLACLAISKWFSGEMVGGTYFTSCVSNPCSLTHINLPMSMISLHMNPTTALSMAFIFCTISATPPTSSTHSFFSLWQHDKINMSIRKYSLKFEKKNTQDGIKAEEFNGITLIVDAVCNQQRLEDPSHDLHPLPS